MRDGEFFVSSLFNNLSQEFDLKTSFERAVQLTEVHTDSGLTNSPPPYLDTAKQHALLDDDGDGVGHNDLSTVSDGDNADDVVLGFARAGSEPDIITIDPDNFGTDLLEPLAHGQNSATLWAMVTGDTVVAPDADAVWVEIRTPGTVLPGGNEQQTIDLVEVALDWNAGESRYETTYSGFFEPGRYTLFYYVKDDMGITSSFERAYVYKQPSFGNSAPGDFDLVLPADGAETTSSGGLGFAWQPSDDPDGDPVTYTLEIRSVDNLTDDWGLGVEVFRQENITRNVYIIGSDAELDPNKPHYRWQVSAVDQYGAVTPSGDWGFSFVLNPTFGWIEGIVYDAITQAPIAHAQIVGSSGLTISVPDGGYYLGLGLAGTYSLSVDAAGYEQQTFNNISVPEGGVATWDLALDPLPYDSRGDADGDQDVDLTDALLVFKAMIGADATGIQSDADVNGDGKIGVAEVVFVLQTIAGLR